jgi:hypothetical protein
MLDPIASHYVHGTGLHWYTHYIDTDISCLCYDKCVSSVYALCISLRYAGDGFAYIDHARQLAPTKFLLATEACEGKDTSVWHMIASSSQRHHHMNQMNEIGYLPFAPGPALGDWTRGEHYGHDIIGDLNHYFIGWTDWNMVRATLAHLLVVIWSNNDNRYWIKKVVSIMLIIIVMHQSLRIMLNKSFIIRYRT